MVGVVTEVNANIYGCGLELMGANEWSVLLGQLLFADDTALAADLEEKIFRFETEVGRVYSEIFSE